MFKDLVLPITGTEGDAEALEAAIVLASHFDARLTVLETVNLPVPAPSPWGLIPDATLSRIYADLREQGQASAARWRARLEKTSVAFDVHLAEILFAEPASAAVRYARYADLSVLAGVPRDPSAAEIVHGFFSMLLMGSGRPVLSIPAGHLMEFPPKRAMVAWRSRREAARALHDALPLLRTAASVDAVRVEAQDGRPDEDAQAGADVASHLARHGLEARVTTLQRQGRSVAAALLRHAEESEAQLLVAGGYGHSRLREWVLGGVTRELLENARIPILFSH